MRGTVVHIPHFRQSKLDAESTGSELGCDSFLLAIHLSIGRTEVRQNRTSPPDARILICDVDDLSAGNQPDQTHRIVAVGWCARIKSGLLKIDLVREVPEAMKPRRIAIDTGNHNQKIEHKEAA